MNGASSKLLISVYRMLKYTNHCLFRNVPLVKQFVGIGIAFTH